MYIIFILFAFLLFSFLVGYVLIFIFKFIFRKRKNNAQTKDFKPNDVKAENQKIEVEFVEERKFLFMDSVYNMTKTEQEKEEYLTDIKVIFEYGKDLIKREMINAGFKSGSKIIDIKEFKGLDEKGYTYITFLIQHENGGEIRTLGVGLNLDKMASFFNKYSNNLYSNGKEKYWYLKNKNKNLMKI